ncbi:MAG: ABC transporter substrate-binding protein [Crocinitomix sp.]|nr:ABC transporter substrate-binding protein [Crocinitomix sp.]
MNQNVSHNIGVLIPQSNAYPLMGKEFMQGLRLGLGETQYKLCIESIAFGADPSQLMNAAQKLIFQEDVSLTTGLLGHHGLSELVEYISKNDEILLVASMGATQPIKLPEGTFENSLGLYDSLRDLVYYLSQNDYNKIESSTCYYESGYGLIHALADAVENSTNIEFSGHFITPHEPRDNEAEVMQNYISEDKPDAIVAFHNGIFAKEHATFLHENKIHEKYPIYALPFSCEDNLIAEFPDVFQEIKPISSWFLELENESNKDFIAAYEALKGNKPSYFSLLGYENGLVIANALKKDLPLKTAIANSNATGPRGPIVFDEESKSTTFNHYLWKIKDGLKEKLTKLEVHPLKTPRQLEKADPKGWFNAYLCH